MFSLITDILSAESAAMSIAAIAIAVLVFAITMLTARFVIKSAPNYDKTKKRNKIYLLIVAACSLFFLFRLGIMSVALYKSIAFTLIMLYASVCDIEERSVPNYVSVLILLLGLSCLTPKMLLAHAGSGILLFLFIFIIAMIAPGKIGGADVKIIGACAFFLGLMPAVTGLMLGLLLSVVITLILIKCKKTDDRKLPLVPYLSTGFLITYITSMALNY